METDRFNHILAQHLKYLADPDTGERANLRGEDLRDNRLRGVNLREAELSNVDLRDVDLTGAILRSANLMDADLRRADLSVSDLRYADMRCANLRDANLSGANLAHANLRDASLEGADLSSTDLTGADLRRALMTRANLRGANLSGAPQVPNIDAAILDAISQPGAELNMSEWHMCATTHCRAGWAIALAGDAGRDLEDRFGPETAGAFIYAASGSHPVPDFYAGKDKAIADMRARAGLTDE